MEKTFNFPFYEKVTTTISDIIATDVENFVNVFYVMKESKIYGFNKIFSPYLPIDLPEMFCILENIKEDLVLDKASVCRVTNVISHEQINKNRATEHYKLNTSTGESYAIKVRKLSNVFIELETSLPNMSQIADKIDLLFKCGYPDIRENYFIKSDRFTNEFLVGTFLNYYYKFYAPQNSGLNGYAKHYIGTILNYPNAKYGLELMDYYPSTLSRIFNEPEFIVYTEQISSVNERGPYSVIIPFTNVLINIFSQVLCNLHFLVTRFHFFHGNLILENVGIDLNKPIFLNYSWKENRINGELSSNRQNNGPEVETGTNISINSPFSVYMLDFSTSSISFTNNYYGENKTIKFYPAATSTAISAFSRVFPFTPKIEEVSGVNVFVIDNILDVTLLNEARNSGLNFPSAFDVYVFMVSSLLNPSIFYRIFSNVELKSKLYDVLWVDKEHVDVYKRLYNFITKSENPSRIEDVVDILKGKKIKCNILEILLHNLSELNMTYPGL